MGAARAATVPTTVVNGGRCIVRKVPEAPFTVGMSWLGFVVGALVGFHEATISQVVTCV